MKEDISLYRWIYEHLLMMIQCGIVPYGQPLPPGWEVAEKFHVSIRPVEQAFGLLKQEGWITIEGRRARVAVQLPPEEIEANYTAHFWARKDAIRDICAFEQMVAPDILITGMRLLPEKDYKRLVRQGEDCQFQNFMGSIHILEEVLRPLANPMLTGLFCDLALFQAFPFSLRADRDAASGEDGLLCDSSELLTLLSLCREGRYDEARRHIEKNLAHAIPHLYQELGDTAPAAPVKPLPFEWQVYRGRPRQVYTVVYEMIKGISRGEYPLDSRLPSIDLLIDQFGASRSTIRRALTVMNSIGVTQPSGGKGTKAIPLVPENVIRGLETYTMQTMLEKYLQALQILSITAPGIVRATFPQMEGARMDDTARRLRECAQQRRWSQLTELFCQLVAESTGNTIVKELYARLLEQIVWGHPLSCLSESLKTQRMYGHCAENLARHLEARDLPNFCAEIKWYFDTLLYFSKTMLLEFGVTNAKFITLLDSLPA